MAQQVGAILVVEIGSLITRVTLVDQVDGETRMVGHATTHSSIEPPYNNALFGILEATAQISELTGRQLLRDGQLIMPQFNDQEGLNHLVVVTSAAGTMALVITAIATDVSARSAVHASRATYTSLLQVVTLDDAASQPTLSWADRSWIERQVETLLSLRPDSVLIAGGLEGGAVDAVNRLAHIVGLTAVSSKVDASGQQQQEVTARPVIYAGNSTAREQVIAALNDRAEIIVTDNLRPSLDTAHLAPARQELARLYERQIMPRLPGMAALRRMSRTPIRTVCEVEGLMARFMAERSERRVLVLDVGSSATGAFYAAPGRYHPAVLGTIGIGYGATTLLAQTGLAALARWLPFPISTAALTERILNRTLRPHSLPASKEDLYLEHAMAREALRATVMALRDETALDDVDWLVAGGGVLAKAPHAGLALLSLLDALEPTGLNDHPILDVYLDTLGLLVASGALAGLDPDLAITVIDRDLLRNQPLASVITLLGDGRLGEVAAEVELTIVGGRSSQVTVRHGELACLSLPQGRYGRLTVRPTSGVRVGNANPGEEVISEGGDLAGSVLGVVLDARGRPLRMNPDPVARRAQLWSWLVALGIEHGASPYADQRLPDEPLAAIEPLAPVQPATPQPLGRKAKAAAVAVPVAAATIAASQDQADPAGAEPAPAPKSKGWFGKAKPPKDAPAAAPAAPAEASAPAPEAKGKGWFGKAKPPKDAPPAEVVVPAAAAESKPVGSGEAVGSSKGKRISLDELKATETSAKPTAQPPASTTGLGDDLDTLRQTIEPPKKRGLFGRKDS
ncbi:MAG: glutamate mutase L [Oscillochloridaceae bacterium umkhey_bin13]